MLPFPPPGVLFPLAIPAKVDLGVFRGATGSPARHRRRPGVTFGAKKGLGGMEIRPSEVSGTSKFVPRSCFHGPKISFRKLGFDIPCRIRSRSRTRPRTRSGMFVRFLNGTRVRIPRSPRPRTRPRTPSIEFARIALPFRHRLGHRLVAPSRIRFAVLMWVGLNSIV